MDVPENAQRTMPSAFASNGVPESQHLRKQEIVLDFMNSKLKGDLHPALNTTNEIRDHTRKTWYGQDILNQMNSGSKDLEFEQPYPQTSLSKETLQDLYIESEAARSSLNATLSNFRSELFPGVEAKASSGGLTDWNEILEMGAQVRDKYLCEDLEGTAGGLRKFARKFCDCAGSLKAFLELLPSESLYGSVLFGTLKIIILSAERLGKVRKKTLEAFENMAEIIEDVRDSGDMFPDDQPLHLRKSAVYACLARGLENILKFFMQSAIKKALKACCQHSGYDQLSGDSNRLKKRIEHFRSRVAFCSQEMVKEVLVNQRASQRGQFEQTLELRRCSALFETQILMYSRMQDSIEKTRQGKTDHRSLAEALLKEKKTKRCSLTADIMMEQIRFDPSNAVIECEQLLNLSAVMSLRDQDRSTAIMRDERLHEWLVVGKSAPLLVNARSAVSTQSPMSLVCASLVIALFEIAQRQDNHVIALCFFCGEHVNQSKDYRADPAGMMLELLGQLIDAYSGFDFSEVEAAWNDFRAADTLNVGSISRVFSSLLDQLPESMILFCIIDGVSYYEDIYRQRDLLEATECLVNATRTDKGPIIKVLMASPATCTRIWRTRLFTCDETLDMNWGVVARSASRGLDLTRLVSESMAEVAGIEMQ